MSEWMDYFLGDRASGGSVLAGTGSYIVKSKNKNKIR